MHTPNPWLQLRAQGALLVGEGAVLKGDQVVRGEGFELEDLGAGNEGGRQGEVWVVRGGADELDGPVFERREKDVLLGFVEAVDLVDEEDGAGAAGLVVVLHLHGEAAAGEDGRWVVSDTVLVD